MEVIMDYGVRVKETGQEYQGPEALAVITSMCLDYAIVTTNFYMDGETYLEALTRDLQGRGATFDGDVTPNLPGCQILLRAARDIGVIEFMQPVLVCKRVLEAVKSAISPEDEADPLRGFVKRAEKNLDNGGMMATFAEADRLHEALGQALPNCDNSHKGRNDFSLLYSMMEDIRSERSLGLIALANVNESPYDDDFEYPAVENGNMRMLARASKAVREMTGNWSKGLLSKHPER